MDKRRLIMEQPSKRKKDQVILNVADNKSSFSICVVALVFSLTSLLFLPFTSLADVLNSNLPSIIYLIVIIFSIVGLVLAIVALSRGKKRTGKAGRVIAIFAALIPIITVVAVLVYFINAVNETLRMM